MGLKSSLCDLRAFGTDGEKALASAFETVFRKAIHLRCFLHLRGNLESRLRGYGIPKHVQIEFIRDVFGNPRELEDGIVDAGSPAEYEAMVRSLQVIWDDREKEYNNPLISYKTQDLPQFVSSMKTMMINQKKEVEKAVAGIGEYRLVEAYRHLAVDTRKFFQMSDKQREKAVNAVFTTSLQAMELPPQGHTTLSSCDHTPSSPKSNPDFGSLSTSISPDHTSLTNPDFTSPFATSISLNNSDYISPSTRNRTPPFNLDLTSPSLSSVCDHNTMPLCVHERPVENPLLTVPIPAYLANKIWEESTKILASNGSVIPSPGCKNESEWLVKSNDLKRKSPYFVECRKNGQVVCEPNCGIYKSSKVCVHAVVVACHTQKLELYVQWLAKQKEGTVSVSKLASIGIPTGSGKKGCRRKASQKKSTKAMKDILDASTESHSYRVNPACCSSDPLPFSSHSQTGTVGPSRTTGEPINSATVSSGRLPQQYPLSQQPMHPPPLLSDNSYARDGRPPPLSGVTQHVTLPYSPMVYAPIMMGLPHHQQVEPSSTSTFWLTFVKGNISRCTGCGQRTL